MQEAVTQPGTEVEINCDMLFLCDEPIINANRIIINTNSIYVSLGTNIHTAPVADGASGINGTPGVNGTDGENGASAGNLTITAKEKMKASADTIDFTSKGGSGGRGGNGGDGKDNRGEALPEPTTAQEVVAQGAYWYNDAKDWQHCCSKWGIDCYHKCTGHSGNYYYRKTISYNASTSCGGKGGNGGNGGNGGKAGLLTILGEAMISANNHREPSFHGMAGTGGAAGPGLEGSIEFHGFRNENPHQHCGTWFEGCHTSYTYTYGGYGKIEQTTPCDGPKGEDGEDGTDWEP